MKLAEMRKRLETLTETDREKTRLRADIAATEAREAADAQAKAERERLANLDAADRERKAALSDFVSTYRALAAAFERLEATEARKRLYMAGVALARSEEVPTFARDFVRRYGLWLQNRHPTLLDLPAKVRPTAQDPARPPEKPTAAVPPAQSLQEAAQETHAATMAYLAAVMKKTDHAEA